MHGNSCWHTLSPSLLFPVRFIMLVSKATLMFLQKQARLYFASDIHTISLCFPAKTLAFSTGSSWKYLTPAVIKSHVVMGNVDEVHTCTIWTPDAAHILLMLPKAALKYMQTH